MAAPTGHVIINRSLSTVNHPSGLVKIPCPKTKALDEPPHVKAIALGPVKVHVRHDMECPHLSIGIPLLGPPFFLLVPVQHTKIQLNVKNRNDELIHPYGFFIWSAKESSVSGFVSPHKSTGIYLGCFVRGFDFSVAA